MTIKKVFYTSVLPIIIIIYFIFSSKSDGTFDEFKLLTKNVKVTKGLITKATEFEHEVESNDSRTIDMAYGYDFDYEFNLPNGVIIKGSSGQYRRLPLNKSIADIPYVVSVEYVEENPEINRVKNLSQNNESLWLWFRSKVLISLIVFIFCCYFGYVMGKKKTAGNSGLAQ